MATESGTSTFLIPLLLPSRLRCAECVGRLCTAVSELPGVLSAECDKRASAMTVIYDSATVSSEELEQCVRDLGLEISTGVEHASYRVTGLD